MSEQVQVIAECSILPGKLDEFRKLAEETIEAAKNNSKVVGYRWYFNSDQTKCYIVEQHPDSGSLIRHLEVVGPSLLKLLDVSSVTRFEVYGSIGRLESVERFLEGVVKTFKIKRLDWNPQNFEYWRGFQR